MPARTYSARRFRRWSRGTTRRFPMTERVCGTCRWHDVDGFYALYRDNARGMDDMGFCRQRPPLPDLTRLLHPAVQDAARTDVFVFALWPETTAEEWCGAWEAREE